MVDGFDGDGRLWVLDEFYKTQASTEDLIVALDGFRKTYGAGPVLCDKSEPESIAKIRRGLPESGILGFATEPYAAITVRMICGIWVRVLQRLGMGVHGSIFLVAA